MDDAAGGTFKDIGGVNPYSMNTKYTIEDGV